MKKKTTYVVQLKITAMLDVKVDAESLEKALAFGKELGYKDVLAENVTVADGTLTNQGVWRDEWL